MVEEDVCTSHFPARRSATDYQYGTKKFPRRLVANKSLGKSFLCRFNDSSENIVHFPSQHSKVIDSSCRSYSLCRRHVLLRDVWERRRRSDWSGCISPLVIQAESEWLRCQSRDRIDFYGSHLVLLTIFRSIIGLDGSKMKKRWCPSLFSTSDGAKEPLARHSVDSFVIIDKSKKWIEEWNSSQRPAKEFSLFRYEWLRGTFSSFVTDQLSPRLLTKSVKYDYSCIDPELMCTRDQRSRRVREVLSRCWHCRGESLVKIPRGGSQRIGISWHQLTTDFSHDECHKLINAFSKYLSMQ